MVQDLKNEQLYVQLNSERAPDGNLRGWLIGGPTPGPLALKNIAGFDITDAAELPGGGVVLREVDAHGSRFWGAR